MFFAMFSDTSLSVIEELLPFQTPKINILGLVQKSGYVGSTAGNLPGPRIEEVEHGICLLLELAGCAGMYRDYYD
jgi:hypothetical protein